MPKNVTKTITDAYRFVKLEQRDFESLNESEQNFLVENRIAQLKAANPSIDSNHDTLAQHRDAAAIIDHFATKADPSKNKANTQHILKLYKAGNIRQEDHSRINSAYSNFEKYKPKLEKKDINSYKTLGEIEDAVMPHLGSHATKAAEVKQIKKDGADLKYEDENISIHHIKTHDAACHYGANTKWCTASKDDPSMFQHYNEQGPIHVLIHKPSGEKMQFHHNSNSFMNSRDEPITPEEFEMIKPSFHKAITAHPEIVGAENLK
jgi:hypothetical protein